MDIGSMTEEQFDSSVASLLSSIPQPPIHTVASGSYASVSSVPPNLLCDSYTLWLYEMYFIFIRSDKGFYMDPTLLIVS